LLVPYFYLGTYLEREWRELDGGWRRDGGLDKDYIKPEDGARAQLVLIHTR